MSNGEFLLTVAAWIRSRTLDGNLSGGQISRRKSDGSLRSAYGTLDVTIIERHNGIPEGESRGERPFSGAVSYFDLEKDAWRSFKADSIQEIDFEYGTI